MRDCCTFYFIIFLIVWTFNETDAIRRRSEKNQQTFVVRYKNGDQTIPVTVVLDDKKQTEYVINMSPRTPDKSVTLYDFKQRTIAYKDLTNRECFLGRLTDETLNLEINALSEVQSPIESNPKVLSLVPHKSALTPTEIRNIAGQKTAVFCRKMNTWLIMPQGNHRISKREVEEVEERSYSHHGFHTVNYSHHGHETRRRYRKPSLTSSQSTQEEERTSKQQSLENDLENRNSPSSKSSNTNHLFFDNLPDISGGNHHHHHDNSFLPETSFKHGDHPTTSNENLNVDKSKRPQKIDLNNFNPQNFEGHLINNNNEKRDYFKNYEDELNNLNRNELFVNGNNKKLIHSFNSNSLPHTSHFHNPKSTIDSTNDETLKTDQYRPSRIETEGDSSPGALDIPEGKNFLFTDIPDESTENPDVSINVLEIPKISKKFETLDHAKDTHEIFVHPNEDVHSIFEGFHKINGNLVSSGSHDSYSPVSIDTIGDHKIIENNSEGSFKASTTEKTSDLGQISFDDFYGQHTTEVTSLTPIAEDQDSFTPNHQDFNNNLNLNVVDHRNFSYKNINHHERKSDDVPSKNKHSTNLDSYKSLTHKNNDNINSSEDFRFDYHNISVDRHSNNNHQVLPKFAINRPVFAPNQTYLHNILRSYKPDEIVIDIEKIPTVKPPDGTSSFRGRDTSFTKTYDHRPSLNKPSFHLRTRNKYLSNITSSNATLNGSQKLLTHHTHLSRRKNFQSHGSSRYPATFNSNNFHRMNFSPKQISPQFLDNLPKLGALPPGVSLHPRHPQAPYADMVRTNMLHTLPQRTIDRPIKPHRQRHHRRKDHDSSTCCNSNSRLSACCSWHLRRGTQINSSCCASFNHHESLEQRINPTVYSRRIKYRTTALPIKDTLPVFRRKNDFSSLQRKVLDDKSNRCQKEKMCRTLYESTRQVMVCRNINVEGC